MEPKESWISVCSNSSAVTGAYTRVGCTGKSVEFGLDLWPWLLYSDSICCEHLESSFQQPVIGTKPGMAEWATRSVIFGPFLVDQVIFLEKTVKALNVQFGSQVK